VSTDLLRAISERSTIDSDHSWRAMAYSSISDWPERWNR
jgi:hypothetical protein